MSFPQISLNRRQLLSWSSTIATGVFLSACVAPAPTTNAEAGTTSASATNPSPQRGGQLRVAVSDDITTLDPAMTINGADITVAHLVYENLARRAEAEPGAPIYPALAEAWEINEDATVYTFKLRQGVTFHHGRAFTAKDVEYSINRLFELAASSAVSLGDLDKMEIVDDFTIKFYLKTPNVVLPYTLSGPGLQIVPHDRTTEQVQQEPAGTGGFRLSARVVGEHIAFKRHETYWDAGHPYLDEVQVLMMSEPATQVAALTSGTIDLIVQIGVDSVAALEGTPDVEVLASNQGVYPIFVMRVDQKPFDDLRVRQAFKHALDRDALHKALMQGRGSVGNDQPVGPGTPFWADVSPLAYDVAKAKALLTEAGYPNGVRLLYQQPRSVAHA